MAAAWPLRSRVSWLAAWLPRAASVVTRDEHRPWCFGLEYTARIREKLSASGALSFVALGLGVIGRALAEGTRFDDGAGELAVLPLGGSPNVDAAMRRVAAASVPSTSRGERMPLWRAS